MHAHYKVQEYRKHFLQSKCEKCAYRKSMPRPATRQHNVLYSIKLQQVQHCVFVNSILIEPNLCCFRQWAFCPVWWSRRCQYFGWSDPAGCKQTDTHTVKWHKLDVKAALKRHCSFPAPTLKCDFVTASEMNKKEKHLLCNVLSLFRHVPF